MHTSMYLHQPSAYFPPTLLRRLLPDRTSFTQNKTLTTSPMRLRLPMRKRWGRRVTPLRIHPGTISLIPRFHLIRRLVNPLKLL